MTTMSQPLTLRGVTIPNRLWLSPMCMYSSTPRHGLEGGVDDWHVSHLGMRAVGGAGLVMVEATAVDPVGRLTRGDLGVWSDAHVDGLRRLASVIEQQGSVPGLQLGHAGPKASVLPPWAGRHQRVSVEDGGWLPWSPSSRGPDPTVHEMTTAEAAAVPEMFAAAAQRARDAGIQVVEVHAAHGYLLHQFLSPLTNMRTDAYGSDRSLLLVQVLEAVRAAWPEQLPLFLRVSAVDWLDGGLTVEDTIRVVNRVKAVGVDLVDVSSGGLPSARIATSHGTKPARPARLHARRHVARRSKPPAKSTNLSATKSGSGNLTRPLLG